MIPVEATKTSAAGERMRRAAASAVARVALSPASPVKALAFPALTTSARARPRPRTRRLHSTGAAAVREVVKTPATAVPGASSTRLRSLWAESRIPVRATAARTPASGGSLGNAAGARGDLGGLTMDGSQSGERGGDVTRAAPGATSVAPPAIPAVKRLASLTENHAVLISRTMAAGESARVPKRGSAMIGGLAQRIFGSANQRVIKGLQKPVAEIGAAEADLERLSDADLRARTDGFRERLQNGEELDDILVEAFATVREASKRTLGQRHFDVQLIGGIVLHEGRIAEMKTGEGKTLAATLPVYLNALEGKGVHVVTVNDYLARRDSEWMGEIYQFLGLEVGCIVHGFRTRSAAPPTSPT